ncbi:protein-L-isoaspartate(D-aspartate) O-methyltransferase [Anaerolineales bacterium HSG25]|nr:protein-L-isoaspartate(D-aspartate) O-methyltransferase [Anaerolineales bacterium HSG25]
MFGKKREQDLDKAQQLMIEDQLKARGIKNEQLLQVMGQLPRHLFVHPDQHNLAYSDKPLPIGQQQTISQPYIVAHMTELLNLPADGNVTVLEVGTGSGYQAAVLSQLVKQVYTVERILALAENAHDVFKKLALTNIKQTVTDGGYGWSNHAPFDRIIVTAAGPTIPPPLVDQLADDGVLIAPVGGRNNQQLIRLTRQGARIQHENLTAVLFVPLRGEHGWQK